MKRKRASVFTDAEKDELIEHILAVPPRGLTGIGFGIELQRKLMAEKLARGEPEAEVGIACANDIDWFLEQCDDQNTLQDLAYHFYWANVDIFMRILDTKLDRHIVKKNDLFTSNVWRQIVFHQKVRLTQSAWKHILSHNLLCDDIPQLCNLFAKIDFSRKVQLSKDAIDHIILMHPKGVYKTTLCALLCFHYPNTIDYIQQISFDKCNFFQTIFRCFPATLQCQIKTFKLVCLRLRKFICKDIEQLIVEEIVKKHVNL